MIATGLFATREGWALTYEERGGDRADKCCGLFYGCGFSLLFANLALLSAICVWVGVASIILFYTIDVRRWPKVSCYVLSHINNSINNSIIVEPIIVHESVVS